MLILNGVHTTPRLNLALMRGIHVNCLMQLKRHETDLQTTIEITACRFWKKKKTKTLNARVKPYAPMAGMNNDGDNNNEKNPPRL